MVATTDTARNDAYREDDPYDGLRVTVDERSSRDNTMSALERGKELFAKAQESRPFRAFKRYSRERANLLAGGIAYVSLFSVGAAMVVGFTILNTVMAGNPELQEHVVQAVDQQLPGLLKINGQEGLVTPEDLFRTDVWSLTGLLSLFLALFSAAGWLNAVREGIRAVWGFAPDEDFILLKKLRDFGIMLTIGLLVVFSALGSLAINSAAEPILGLVGLDGTTVGRYLLQGLGAFVVLVLDTAMLIVLFRLLTGISIPWQVLLPGCLAGAVGFGLLKMFTGTLLAGAGGNPVLASSAVLVGLALWLNLNARVTLGAAAWAAESAVDFGVYELRTAAEGYNVGAHEPDHAHPIGPELPAAKPVGHRLRDTISLGTGVVIGAVFLSGVRVLRSVQGRRNDDSVH